MKIRTTRRTRRKLTAVLAASAMAALLSACGGAQSDAAGQTTINWWTWDDKQAVGYQACATSFEKANPGVRVKISHYNSLDYFTKLLAGFVAGTAPDAFMDSVQYLQQYASLDQLMPLDPMMKKTHFDINKFSVGVDAWKYKDGKQYGLPLDWASAALYYNEGTLKKAGYTPAEVSDLNWNPDNGGTFGKMVAHLTVDRKGIRGDQPGFDKNHVVTYGVGPMTTKDFTGQTTWSPFVTSLGWRIGNKASWPTAFNYDDPRFVKTMNYFRALTDKGFAPKDGEFASAGNVPSGVDMISSGKIAMYPGGSWEAAQFAQIPKIKVGIAPNAAGPDGTRAMIGGSNGNTIWSGTKHPDLTWKWVSYMATAQCQTEASAGGSFFPSIQSAMDASAKTMKKKGVDLSIFTEAQRKGQVLPYPPYGNGTAIGAVIQPMFQQFFAHSSDDEIFKQMTEETRKLLAKKN
jgi:ABC-type glycerol-3-phosphate transport system substrate-binding protein